MARTYFHALNYTIGNEDSLLEYAILPEKAKHVIAIAGCGSRVIPLLARNPRQLTCVDFSSSQLALTELRLATVRELPYEEFLAFWGYPPHSVTPAERASHFRKLEVSRQAKEILKPIFEAMQWESLLYTGKWERTFQKLSKVNRALVGKKGLGMFDCLTISEQRHYLKKQFPHKAWSLVVFLLGNATIFNALLYKGHFPKRTFTGSMYDFYMQRFSHLFTHSLARENYFLQLLFFGTLRFADGLPAEGTPTIFEAAKQSLHHTQVNFVQGDIIEEIQQSPEPADFVSLSDVPSYLQPPREQSFLQDIKESMSNNGIVVNRYYLRTPERLQTSGYQRITDAFQQAIKAEKVNMYSIDILKKNE
ncbi:MAG: DUF3419 family protein [bacterium]